MSNIRYVGNEPLRDKLAKYLSLKNVLHHIMLAFNREFVRGRQSFFQRVVQGDEPIGRHFVGVIARIDTNDKREHVIHISDGNYCLKSTLLPHYPEGSVLTKTCQSELERLIRIDRIKVGTKLHLINQGLTKELKEGEPETEHYLLANSDKHRLVLNFNGMYPAEQSEKLGVHKQAVMLRNLGSVFRSETPSVVSMLDVVVVKKYPVSFTEFVKQEQGTRNLRYSRSYQTFQHLFDKN